MDKQWTISSEKYLERLIELTAYSIGAILGDGHMRFIPSYGNGSWYVTEVASMDREISLRVANEFNGAFGTGYKPIQKRLPNGSTLFIARASKKIIYDFFDALTNKKQGAPIEIVRGSKQMKLDFLAGIFDTDGTVKFTEAWNGSRTKKNPRWQMGFSNTIPQMVEDTAAILHSLGVKVGSISTYKRSGGYRTVYAIHPNIRSFMDAGCYFYVVRKQRRLNDYLSHVLGSETMYVAPVTSGEDIVQQ